MPERKRFNVATVAELRAALAHFPDDMLVRSDSAWSPGKLVVSETRLGPCRDTNDPYYGMDDAGFTYRRICNLREVEEDDDV